MNRQLLVIRRMTPYSTSHINSENVVPPLLHHICTHHAILCHVAPHTPRSHIRRAPVRQRSSMERERDPCPTKGAQAVDDK